ncbi:hypothetical protein N0V82_004111 [Gnomoniopsis sp. IMI 355080]|nr:hypothetical protein N0V82_004111 [Gnomoniopsis sp. IMI 355080]
MVFDQLASRLPEAVMQPALTGDVEAVETSYKALSFMSPGDKNAILIGIAECAAINLHVELLEWCFAAGLDMPPNMTNTTLYHQAMDSRSLAIWEVLIRHGLDLNATYSEACGDVFSEAVREGNVELARFLLENGQDPNVAQGSSHQGFWEIGACALLGDKPSRAVEILNDMLRHGWAQRPNKYQSGAAHIVAAKIGHLEALKLLVEHGADLDLAHNCNDWGGSEWDWYQDVTALFAAAYNGHEDAVAYLLEKGANPMLRDKRGYSCLWAARKGGNEKVVSLIERSGVTE